jgi:hypothetical protein
MNEHDSGSGAAPQKRNAHRSVDDKIQYLLMAEEQLLQAISSHASLPKVLNEICSALDFRSAMWFRSLHYRVTTPATLPRLP